MRTQLISFLVLATAALFHFVGAPAVGAESRPNIVVIMTDDMGYSDLGCYGGEIETPNLDALAAEGLRFSQFYNTAKCHSSRVSLLTGQYCLAAGNTSLSNAVTSAEVLASGGYFTAMTGKWHLKREPTDFGFDRYFGHLSGACNFFKGDNTFRLNGEKWQVPKEGFYTTVAKVDWALKFLGEARQTKKPWYLYIAFNAPHAPLHALPEDYAKYKGRYDEGWDTVRQGRIDKQNRLGVLPADLQASARPEHIPAWSELEPWRQKYEANRMVTLAAMIDRVDQEVGRLVQDLKRNGEFENTLIVFVSDNGACPYDRRKPLLDIEPTNGDIALADSTGWSWVRNSPFRYYKQNQYEGGISTPGIFHWPAGIEAKSGSVTDQAAHLIDILPTLAEISGCKIPDTWPNREVRPVSGVSLVPVLKGEVIKERPPIHLLFSTDRGLRDGNWKAVSFRSQGWELYNLKDDRAERNNLAEAHPERLQRMVDQWTAMTRDVLHAGKGSYAPVKPAKLPHHNPQWTDFTKKPAGAIASGDGTRRPGKQRIRARKNTTLKKKGGEIQLTFSGDDPGIALDLRGHKLPVGPYELKFSLRGGTVGGGDVFYTTDGKTKLPAGMKIEFEVKADGKWQSIGLPLDTRKSLMQLRVDVSDGPGEATIKDLHLLHHDGTRIELVR